jgi:hypothetical protein
MKTNSNHYVYAYFDPRNYEMFYVGKGQGSRKDAHKPTKKGTAMQHRLHDIREAGLKPLIRVIAANLTEDQALLVEKALIWRTGGSLTNISGGHYADYFRPQNSLHKSLPGFDTVRGIYFANVGGNQDHRAWADSRKFGFLAAGYGREFSSQLDRLVIGSIIAAYLNKHGYVGIGEVTANPVPSKDFRYKGRRLLTSQLVGKKLLHDPNDDELCEYLVAVKWIKSVPQEKAKFRKKAGLFAIPLIVASLTGQPKTLRFLQQQFNVNFETLLSKE